jgi:hypothetical protein
MYFQDSAFFHTNDCAVLNSVGLFKNGIYLFRSLLCNEMITMKVVIEGKVVPVLKLIKHCAMKVHGGLAM